jgi:hypothetical protein
LGFFSSYCNTVFSLSHINTPQKILARTVLYKKINNFAGLEVLMVVAMKITVFWNVTPYYVVDQTSVLEEPAASILRVEEGVRCV